MGAREVADQWTSSADVDATKPDPDLIDTAMQKVGGGDGVMVGDSTWELRDAGADPVFESLPALRDGLDRTPFAPAARPAD